MATPVSISATALPSPASGSRFAPGLSAATCVSTVFALYDAAAGDTDALARYRHARDALRLTLASASGAPVAVRDLRVRPADSNVSGRTGLVLEIETDDPAFWASTPPVTR